MVVGDARQLVGEGDVEVAVSGLGELGQLGRLRGAHRPDLGVEERAVELDGARLAGRAQAPDQLGVRGEVPEDPAAVDALGREDEVEVALGDQPAGLLEQRREAAARRVQRDGRLDAHGRPGLQPIADGADRRVERTPARARAAVDRQGRDGDDEVGSGGHGVGRARARAQAPRADRLLQRLGEPGLAGERRLTGVDGVDHGGVDVAADDLVAGAGDLRGQRKADLAQGDDHRSHDGTRTVSPVAALRRTLSAQMTVARPSSRLTTGGPGSPRSSAENASSSTSSGSRRESA